MAEAQNGEGTRRRAEKFDLDPEAAVGMDTKGARDELTGLKTC